MPALSFATMVYTYVPVLISPDAIVLFSAFLGNPSTFHVLATTSYSTPVNVTVSVSVSVSLVWVIVTGESSDINQLSSAVPLSV